MRGSMDTQLKMVNPGRMTTVTPIKPMITAIQRCLSTISPKSGAARIVTNKGDTKRMTTQSANGKNINANQNVSVAATRKIERRTCNFIFFV